MVNKLKIDFDTSNLDGFWQSLKEVSLDNAIFGFLNADKKESRRRIFWSFLLLAYVCAAVFCLFHKQFWFVFPSILFFLLWCSQTRTLTTRKEQKALRVIAAFAFLGMKEVESISDACTLLETLFSNIPLTFAEKHCIQLYTLAELARRVGWLAPFTEIKEENIFRHKYDDEEGVLEIYYTHNDENCSIAFPCEKREVSAEFDSISYNDGVLIYNERS